MTTAFVIEKLPEGGFVVLDASFLRQSGLMASALFAATAIDDALGYIKDKLEPEAKAEAGMMRDMVSGSLHPIPESLAPNPPDPFSHAVEAARRDVTSDAVRDVTVTADAKTGQIGAVYCTSRCDNYCYSHKAANRCSNCPHKWRSL